MTFEEYHYYSDIANRLFNYMNGNINVLNSNCSLYIDMYDYITGTYANIRYPNFVTIHIGTIIDTWKESWEGYINKKDFICTCIAWALSHELHHADQLISMIQYKSNIEYKDKVEADVSRASYDWVLNHSKELSSIGGFTVVINDLDSVSLPDHENYTKASVKEFYLQTIANIILRDLDLFNKLSVFTNDSITDDIILIFNNQDQIAIKSFGNYIPENVNTFSQLAYKWAGYFDRYRIAAEMTRVICNDGRKLAIVKFNISDQLVNGMIMKK